MEVVCIVFLWLAHKGQFWDIVQNRETLVDHNFYWIIAMDKSGSTSNTSEDETKRYIDDFERSQDFIGEAMNMIHKGFEDL